MAQLFRLVKYYNLPRYMEHMGYGNPCPVPKQPDETTTTGLVSTNHPGAEDRRHLTLPRFRPWNKKSQAFFDRGKLVGWAPGVTL